MMTDLDTTILDKVIKDTIQAVEKSQHQIFDITEQAREESKYLVLETERVKKEVLSTVEKTDELERVLMSSRIHLSEVSRHFHRFTEEDIHRAYEETNNLQIEHFLLVDKEKQLRARRDDLQLRLKRLDQMVNKAESILTHLGVILHFLAGDMKNVGELIEDAKHKQQMGLEIIQAQEEERRRVAREIHDGPAQSMANVILRTELVEKILSQDNLERARVELKELKEVVRESIADVRRIIFDLRPMALDDLGIIPTLNNYIEVLSNKYSINIELKTFGKEKRLPSIMEVAVFRLVQESLTNVVKHAKAQLAQIKLEFQPKKLYVVIKDDGIGFNKQEKLKEGFGILGMQERIKLLDGQMVYQSAPGEGTKIMLMIPIKLEE